jgi:hypothetical protein
LYQASKPNSRTSLEVTITGATKGGDMRQSLERAVKLDTGSPENLISWHLCKDLGAEPIKDNDSLYGANKTSLEVLGAAMVWLTWNGKLGTRRELIYCLVIKTLTEKLVVSEDRDPALFKELRDADGPWVDPRGRGVLVIELDKLTPKERKDLIRRREEMLKRAKDVQVKKDNEGRDGRNKPKPQPPQREP